MKGGQVADALMKSGLKGASKQYWVINRNS